MTQSKGSRKRGRGTVQYGWIGSRWEIALEDGATTIGRPRRKKERGRKPRIGGTGPGVPMAMYEADWELGMWSRR